MGRPSRAVCESKAQIREKGRWRRPIAFMRSRTTRVLLFKPWDKGSPTSAAGRTAMIPVSPDSAGTTPLLAAPAAFLLLALLPQFLAFLRRESLAGSDLGRHKPGGWVESRRAAQT